MEGKGIHLKCKNKTEPDGSKTPEEDSFMWNFDSCASMAEDELLISVAVMSQPSSSV
jgi:hypothetical protein